MSRRSTAPDAGSGRRRVRRGPSRRRLLAASAVGATVGTAGCLGGDGGQGPTTDPAVYVFNTGDKTLSVVDPDALAVLQTASLGVTASFPANQWARGLVESADDHLWINTDTGVAALRAGDLSVAARVETGSGLNWQELTPDGRRLVVSAREPAHRQFLVDARPDSPSFGDVRGEIDRTVGYDGRGDGPGPCDVTIHPDGEYAYVPDLAGDTLTVLSVPEFEIVEQVPVDPVFENTAASPWMATVDTTGEYMTVEHSEGDGTEGIWDLSDPSAPREIVRLTPGDGLGTQPLTSEIHPETGRGFVFTPGSQDVTVIDLDGRRVERRLDLGGKAYTGTWDPDGQRLFVPVQTRDEVAVVDPSGPSIVDRLSVGKSPYGATAGRVRPAADAGGRLRGRLAALGAVTGGTTFCRGECHCGPGAPDPMA